MRDPSSRCRSAQTRPAAGFAFAHDLAQQSIAGALSLERARLVHRRLALGGESAGAAPAAIAAHHEASGDPRRAAAHRLAAGDEARRLRALPEAMAQWSKALADGPTPAQALALHERLSRVAYERTDFAAVRAQADALGTLLEGGGLEPEQRIAAAIARALAAARSGHGQEALAILDALPGEPTGRQRYDALWARGVACNELGRNESAAQAVHAALALPDLTDLERSELLDFAFLCEFNAGRNDAALAHAEAALAIARRLGDSPGLARGHYRRGIVLLTTGQDPEAAERELVAASETAGRLGMVHVDRIAQYNLTCVYASQGRHGEALAAAERGWNLAPALEASDFRVMYLLAMVDAHFALGDLGAAWRFAEAAVEEAIALHDPRVRIGAATCTLELLGMIGELALARRLLAVISVDSASELKAAGDEMWIALAQFELRQGALAAAKTALAELDATGEVVVTRVRVRHGQARAELALQEGDPSRALALLPADDTLGMNGEMRSRGLALRVTAEAARGRIDPATAETARRRLAAAPDHQIATLELRTALARAESAGIAGAPPGSAQAHAALVATLVETLGGQPTRQGAFRRAWG